MARQPEPDQPGSYLLVIRTRGPRTLRVGRLGERPFAPGWHVYAGSALRGLRGRLAHHLRPCARPHWHVDYLHAAGELVSVWTVAGTARQECALAAAVAALPGAARCAGFGSSDCRCPGHLVSFARRPPLGAAWPGLRLLRLPRHAEADEPR